MVIRVHFVHFKPFVWDFGFDLVGLAKHGLKERWRAKWNEKKNPARISNYIGASGSKMKQKIYCTLTCMWNCERNEFYRSISDASYAFFARCTCHFGANNGK